MIGITEPRRIATTSLATRIAHELTGKPVGHEVGYQIRYDSNTCSDNTVVKLMTDGILLKELENGLAEQYSVIIIDEAHERSVNTDILISLLSRIVRIRVKLA